MTTFLSIVYVVVCLFLILVVLLQSGKGGGLGSAFGGGGAGQQIFGGAGAGNLLTRLTAFFAFLFMVLSAVLAYLSSSGEQALDRAVREQGAAQTAEAEPGEDADEGVVSEPNQTNQVATETTSEPSEAVGEDAEATPLDRAESDVEKAVEDLQKPEGPAVPGPYR